MPTNCFICGVIVNSNSCPICYNCAQAYKRAIIECIGDIKKDSSIKKIDVGIIAQILGNDKYAPIVRGYLQKERLAGVYDTSKIEENTEKAVNYIYNPKKASSIISELYYKGIIMMDPNGNLIETPEDMVDDVRNANQESARAQNMVEQSKSIQFNKPIPTPTPVSNGSRVFVSDIETRSRGK